MSLVHQICANMCMDPAPTAQMSVGPGGRMSVEVADVRRDASPFLRVPAYVLCNHWCHLFQISDSNVCI